MNKDDIQGMAQEAGRKVKNMVQDESGVERLRDAAQHADKTVRDFARAQPVMALVVAIGAGYLVGRAIARIT